MATHISKGKATKKVGEKPTIEKPKKDKLEVIYLDVEEIARYENNPRKNKEAVATVRKSIETFGWRQPIVVDKDYVIIAGDTRFQAALSMGLQQVPCHIATNLTPEQVQAYRIADNKVSEVAEWDDARLTEELSALMSSGFDMSGLGFSEADIAALGTPKKDTRWLEDYDTQPPPKSKWILISAPEDQCADILQVLGEMKTPEMRYEYSGDAE